MNSPFSFYFPILVIVLGNVLYNISQKATPTQIDPLVALAVTYSVALALTLFFLAISPTKSTALGSLKQVNWASIVLGISILLVELGFLYAYRVGWKLSVASLTQTLGVLLVLVPIALIFFKERLSAWNALGVALAVVALFLMHRK